MAKRCDASVKLFLVGDSGVGKTCLIRQYACNEFNESHRTTIGVDFKIKVINLDGKNVTVQFWDTAGQERFEAITKQSFTKAEGCVLVYDIGRSFDSIRKWLFYVKQYAKEDISVIIIGNKSDLEGERKVSPTIAQQFADQNNLKFYETSAKDPETLKQPFEDICRDILRTKSRTLSTDTEIVDLTVPPADLSQSRKAAQRKEKAKSTSQKSCCAST